VNVNTGFTTNQPSSPPRSFGRAVAINDNGTLIATDRVSGSPALYYTRLWSSTTPDIHADLYAAPGGLGDFSSLQTFTDINDNGDAAFVGLESNGSLRDVEFEPKANLPGVSNTVDAFSVFGPAPGGGVA